MTTEVGASEGTIPRWPPVSLLPEEFFLLVEDCLQLKGFAPVVDVNDYTISFPGSQPGSDQARDECIEEIDPTYLEPPPSFTEAQLADLFEYVKAQRDCYHELGYPRVDLPSRSAFDSELQGRFDPAGVIAANYGDAPSEEDLEACRSRNRPSWFFG